MEALRTLRVVVADSQPLFRYGLTQLIAKSAYLRVVGEASTPAEALRTVREVRPDVLILTVGEGFEGRAALKAVQDLPSNVRCIVVTNGFDVAADAAFVQIGCVLPHDSSGSKFLHCIRCVTRHQCWPVRNGDDFTPLEPQAEPPKANTRYRLTERETQIVAAVADGASNKDIAAQLAIAEDTVKHHMSNIFDKVGVHSRLELAVFALHHGIV